jgi:hypothetical protein
MAQFIKVTVIANILRDPCEPEILYINAEYIPYFCRSVDRKQNPTTDLFLEYPSNRPTERHIVKETPEEILAQLK